MREPLPLATVHEAVLDFLRGRDDVVVFGATAVNAYVAEPRMTQDIDLMSPRAAELAEQLRAYLNERLDVGVRVIGEGKGYRISQVREAGNRHLVDIRSGTTLTASRRIEDVSVASPAELIATKVACCYSRRGRPKSFSDRRDLAVLLLQFPDLKTETGAVQQTLKSLGVSEEVLNSWGELVREEIRRPDEYEKFYCFVG